MATIPEVAGDHRAGRLRRRMAAGGISLVLLGAGIVVVGPGLDPSAGTSGDHQPAGAVELPQLDAGVDPAPPPRQPNLPPPCLAVDGSPCADPLLGNTDLTDAVRVIFGAVVVDSALTVRRLQLIGDRSQVRWGTEVPAASNGAHRPPDDQPVRSRLARTGTTLLLGTPDHLHSLGTIDGLLRWSTALEEFGDGRTPWHGWVVGDVVIGATPAAIVVLDAGDGHLRWYAQGPFEDVLPLASGVAVIRAGRVQFFDATGPEPDWSVEVVPTARFPRGADHPDHGPVVVTGGGPRMILDASTGAVLGDLGLSAQVTRSTTGQVVATQWDDITGRSALVGFGTDGQERWRIDGPAQPCCRIDLRPTADGRVIALFPGAAGTEAGWIVDPTTGSVADRITRPADVAWVPRAVAGSTLVWMDGAAFVAADPDGTPRWRAESEARLLTAAPLLLGTREGLVRPPAIAPSATAATAATAEPRWPAWR